MSTGIPPTKPVNPEPSPSVPLEEQQGGRFGGFSDKPGQDPAQPAQKDT